MGIAKSLGHLLNLTAALLRSVINGCAYGHGAQIKRLQDEPVSEKELDRFKTQIVASKVYEKDSMFYQAMQIGTLTTVGLDWHLMDQYVDKVRAVTPAQIQAVARKYLVDDGLTVGILDPQKIPAQAARITNGGTHAQFIN